MKVITQGSGITFIDVESYRKLERELETTKKLLKEAVKTINYYAHDGGRDNEDVELLVKQFSGHLLDVQVGGKKAREFLKSIEDEK